MHFPTSALILGLFASTALSYELLGYDDIDTEKTHISNDGKSCTKIDPPVTTIDWDTSAPKAKSCYCYDNDSCQGQAMILYDSSHGTFSQNTSFSSIRCNGD